MRERWLHGLLHVEGRGIGLDVRYLERELWVHGLLGVEAAILCAIFVMWGRLLVVLGLLRVGGSGIGLNVFLGGASALFFQFDRFSGQRD